LFYLSLLAAADDEMLVRDDTFDLKLLAWPSPLDADMTVELFEKWRDGDDRIRCAQAVHGSW